MEVESVSARTVRQHQQDEQRRERDPLCCQVPSHPFCFSETTGAKRTGMSWAAAPIPNVGEQHPLHSTRGCVVGARTPLPNPAAGRLVLLPAAGCNVPSYERFRLHALPTPFSPHTRFLSISLSFCPPLFHCPFLSRSEDFLIVPPFRD